MDAYIWLAMLARWRAGVLRREVERRSDRLRSASALAELIGIAGAPGLTPGLVY